MKAEAMLIRVKLMFDPPDMLGESLVEKGMHHCWHLIPSQLINIGELEFHLLREFQLEQRCPKGIRLEIDGFTIPSFQSVKLIRDGDTIRVHNILPRSGHACLVPMHQNGLTLAAERGPEPAIWPSGHVRGKGADLLSLQGVGDWIEDCLENEGLPGEGEDAEPSSGPRSLKWKAGSGQVADASAEQKVQGQGLALLGSCGKRDAAEVSEGQGLEKGAREESPAGNEAHRSKRRRKGAKEDRDGEELQNASRVKKATKRRMHVIEDRAGQASAAVQGSEENGPKGQDCINGEAATKEEKKLRHRKLKEERTRLKLIEDAKSVERKSEKQKHRAVNKQQQQQQQQREKAGVNDAMTVEGTRKAQEAGISEEDDEKEAEEVQRADAGTANGGKRKRLDCSSNEIVEQGSKGGSPGGQLEQAAPGKQAEKTPRKEGPSRSAKRKKAKRRWLRLQAESAAQVASQQQVIPALQAQESPGVDAPSQARGGTRVGGQAGAEDEPGSPGASVRDAALHDKCDDVVGALGVVKKGHIRFEPVEEGDGADGASRRPMPVLRLGDPRTKKQGQAWGQERSKVQSFVASPPWPTGDIGMPGRPGNKKFGNDSARHTRGRTVEFAPPAWKDESKSAGGDATGWRSGGGHGPAGGPEVAEKPVNRRTVTGLPGGDVPVRRRDIWYQQLATLEGPPHEGDELAYRLLELSSSWTPEVSSFREGQVVGYDAATGLVRLVMSAAWLAELKEELRQKMVVQNEENGEGEEEEEEEEKEDAAEIELPQPYKEDGELEVELSALLDVRCISRGRVLPTEVVSTSESDPLVTLAQQELGASASLELLCHVKVGENIAEGDSQPEGDVAVQHTPAVNTGNAAAVPSDSPASAATREQQGQFAAASLLESPIESHLSEAPGAGMDVSAAAGGPGPPVAAVTNGREVAQKEALPRSSGDVVPSGSPVQSDAGASCQKAPRYAEGLEAVRKHQASPWGVWASMSKALQQRREELTAGTKKPLHLNASSVAGPTLAREATSANGTLSLVQGPPGSGGAGSDAAAGLPGGGEKGELDSRVEERAIQAEGKLVDQSLRGPGRCRPSAEPLTEAGCENGWLPDVAAVNSGNLKQADSRPGHNVRAAEDTGMEGSKSKESESPESKSKHGGGPQRGRLLMSPGVSKPRTFRSAAMGPWLARLRAEDGLL